MTLKNTSEAELMVRVGDIDACNDENAATNGYNPFTQIKQYLHSSDSWTEAPLAPEGTDRIYVGSMIEETDADNDSYSNLHYKWRKGEGNYPCAKGALTIKMNYESSSINVKNALLQFAIHDFQADHFDANYIVSLNGRDAQFIAEILNHVEQEAKDVCIISAIIPSSFYNEIASGKLVIKIDETNGISDGHVIDFVKLLVNYDKSIFTCHVTGFVGGAAKATVRLLGTSTTVTTDDGGMFTFEAIQGMNIVRASADGYIEQYDFGIVWSTDTEWEPRPFLPERNGTPDLDFSKFAATEAWSKASGWAAEGLNKALEWDLIPDVLKGADMTKPINRAEFAAVCVKVYENLSSSKAQPAAKNPFTDCNDLEVLKAYNVGLAVGTSSTTSSPNMLLNCEQAATMLTRVHKKVMLNGWTIDTDSQFKLDYTKPAPFADDNLISDWAKDSVYFMVANNIIKGIGNNKFAPKNTTTAEAASNYANATREQALIIAANMVENLNVNAILKLVLSKVS